MPFPVDIKYIIEGEQELGLLFPAAEERFATPNLSSMAANGHNIKGNKYNSNMKAWANKNIEDSSKQSSKPFFDRKGESSFSPNQRQAGTPFFSPSVMHSQSLTEDFKGDKSKEKVAWFNFMIGIGGGVRIIVTQDLSNGYHIKAVTSSAYGITLGFSWEQSSFTVNIEKNIATIDVYGILNYNVFLEGIGTFYSEPKQFRVKTNTSNGEEVSLEVVQ